MEVEASPDVVVEANVFFSAFPAQNKEPPTCRPKLYIFNSISPVKSASSTLLAMSETEVAGEKKKKKERENKHGKRGKVEKETMQGQ